MAASSYDEALRRVLAHEGGYTNHPSDPGGPTNYGITIHDYRKYVKPGATAADVRAMTLAEAKAIYRSKYWNALRCDELPAGVDYATFDYCVNSGVGRAGKVLRRVLDLQDDSYVVTDTVLAALRGRDASNVVAAICDERLAFLKRLKTWPVFGRGWGPRVADVRRAALAMAKGAKLPPLDPAVADETTGGKADVPVNTNAQNGAAGAVIVAGGGWLYATAHDPVAFIIGGAVIVLAAVAMIALSRANARSKQEVL
ncbi:MAG: glycoside hydrolase family 108 protein [Rhizobiales bacterium]|nr:glycoside hydrolase family 108 protein [Hyphomicrobiales bacterium]